MAEYLGVQQPPTKKMRLAGTPNDNDFDFKMVPSYGTTDPTDAFDLFSDLADPVEMPSQPAQVPPQMYPSQPTMTYLPPARPQAPTPQMPPTYPTQTMIRPVNGLQPTGTMYNSPRPVYARMPMGNAPATGPNPAMIRTGYNAGPMNNLAKVNDPNNNRVFIANPSSQAANQAQAQSVMIGAQPAQQTVTQTGKPLSTGLPSLSTPQQFNLYPNYSNNPQSTTFLSHPVNSNPTQPNGPVGPQAVPISHPPASAQQGQPAAPQPPPNPGGNNGTTNSTIDVQRKQFIQKQLVLLLHAHKCQQREKQNSTGNDPTRSNPCNLQHCNTMKNVLQHMAQCGNNKTCPVAHCVTSRQIILHWKNCTNPLCSICQPLKAPGQQQQQQHGNGTVTNNAPPPPPPPTNPATATSSGTNPTVMKDWQRRVTQDMRNCLVQKIISALVPTNEASTMMDKRLVNLANYARRVENETFDVANNQEEYFHKLAEKIYKIQKELEERREKKRLLDLQNSGKRPSSIDILAGVDGPPNRTAPSIKTETTFNSNAFAVTNVPADDSLQSLLNGEPTHQIETKRSLTEGTTSTIKQEFISPPKIEETRIKIDASAKNLPKIPVQFTADELRLHLQPVIEKMIACEDSPPFRQPVDPILLQIPDYPLIIKHPMDISTMQNKLESGEYENPLQFCDDAWLMFNNAWTYNKKTTRVYKMCTKLSEVFAEAIDPAMQKLGYCCGRSYVYLPQVMFCYGNQLCCQIARDGPYYYYTNPEPSRYNLSGDKYTFCAKCFDSAKGESIFVGDDPAQTLVELPKSAFLPAKNDIQEPEAMINCVVCTRRWHQVCALHLDQIWPEGFICRTCLREHHIQRKDNRFTATRLIQTELALHLEKRVNDFLRRENCQTGRVTIRTLAASDKICEVKPRLKKYYQNQVPDGYPYRAKAIFAFQEIDGVDVVLFGMHVQEYDGRCQQPNSRRIYFSYLDSVHFFRPKQYRTEVYHELLIGYLDYAQRLGYVYAHIWACPPSEGDDYIFHCHPPEQRVPKPKRLQEWYKKMLDKAAAERVVVDFKDALKDCLDNQVQSALQIPYFEGDFWANIIEESIKELDQEEEDRRKQEVEAARAIEDGNLDDSLDADDATEMSDKRKSANTQKKKALKKTTSSQRKVAKKQVSNCTDLMTKIFSTMDKHREAFFVIRLQNPIAATAPINDTDALIQCDLMDTRDAFLNFARDKHYEFSSLRRAQFSTMALLYELHTSTTDKFTYNCNSCRQQCEVRYHCTECEDFDLCEKCYNTEPKHKHRMERSVPPMVDAVSSGASSSGSNMATSQLQRQQAMQRCIDALLHALNCRNANCVNRSCLRYKQVIQHTRECKGKNSQCNVCKQMIFLCWYHAKTCVDPNCQVPFCTNLKSKIQKQRATSLQTDRRRMQAMKQHQRTSTMQSTASISNPTPVTTYDSASSGKPTTTLSRPPPPPQAQPPPQSQIHIQQQGTWPNANYGKPVNNNPVAVMINRMKSERTGDDSQRTDVNDNKQQQLFAPLIGKNPPHRMPTPTNQPNPSVTPVQFNTAQQQWYVTNSHPPPTYSTATQPRFTQVLSQQQQHQQQGQQPQAVLTPLRSHTSPPAYSPRTGSPVPLQRASLPVPHARPSPYQSSSQPQQDPSLR